MPELDRRHFMKLVAVGAGAAATAAAAPSPAARAAPRGALRLLVPLDTDDPSGDIQPVSCRSGGGSRAQVPPGLIDQLFYGDVLVRPVSCLNCGWAGVHFYVPSQEQACARSPFQPGSHQRSPSCRVAQATQEVCSNSL